MAVTNGEWSVYTNVKNVRELRMLLTMVIDDGDDDDDDDGDNN